MATTTSPTEEAPPAETAQTTGLETTALDGLSAADRRRLRRGWLAGAVPSIALFTWMLSAGRADLGRQRFLGGLFDAQARAMANGRWDVPVDEAWFEGFLLDEKVYIYFGPFPAIIRLPILAITDALDGHLTVVSMLAAMVVLAVAAFRLLCVLRPAVRNAGSVTRTEVQLTAVIAVATLVAPPFFLASATMVYHEATMWGVALAVAGFNSVARWQRDPTRRRLILATAVISLAMLSRQSIAFGPLVALGLAGLVQLVRGYRSPGSEAAATTTGWGGAAVRARRLAPTAGALVLAGLVAAGPSLAVNYAKFGELGLPMEHQRHSHYDEHRQAVLAENPNMMGIEYVPTAAWQYVRPDGFSLRRDFPWIDFPTGPPAVLFPEPTFDTLDWTSSIPTMAPALVVLSLAGLAWAVARRRPSSGDDPPLFPLVVGAAASSVGVLILAYVANRYLADVYPLVLIGGFVGFHAGVGYLAAGARPWLRRGAIGCLGVLVTFGVLTNMALALSYQRERGHDLHPDWHAEYVRWRLDLPGSTPVIHLEPDVASDFLKDPGGVVADGTVVVVGDCESVYVGLSSRDPRPDARPTTFRLVEGEPDEAVVEVLPGDTQDPDEVVEPLPGDSVCRAALGLTGSER